MTSERKNVINMYAQVFASCQVLSLKKWWEFRHCSKQIKKVTNFICFPNVPCRQQHFDISNGKLVYCFHREFSFWDRIIIKKVNKPFIFKQYIANLSAKTRFIQILLITLFIHISKPLNIQARASQQAGGDLFSWQ